MENSMGVSQKGTNRMNIRSSNTTSGSLPPDLKETFIHPRSGGIIPSNQKAGGIQVSMHRQVDRQNVVSPSKRTPRTSSKWTKAITTSWVLHHQTYMTILQRRTSQSQSGMRISRSGDGREEGVIYWAQGYTLQDEKFWRLLAKRQINTLNNTELYT